MGDIPFLKIERLDLFLNINFHQIYILDSDYSNQYFEMFCENL